MLNSGQTCTAWTRLLVPRAAFEAALRLAAARAEEFTVGDPTRPETDLGPLVSAAQRRTVTGFIERAAAGGARIVTGGPQRPAGLVRGHYVQPTVVTDVAPDAEIVQEEVFGPVLTVQSYEDVDEAITLANGTPYGLAGAVWGDRDAAVAVARRLRTGQVDINGGAFNPAAPFGGYRRSGNGRELGRWGIEEFLETKALQL